MKQCGTVLPTKKIIEQGNKHYQQMKLKAEKTAKQSLNNCTVKIIQGEKRYYESETKYATVSTRDLKIRWFKVTEDGDYPA